MSAVDLDALIGSMDDMLHGKTQPTKNLPTHISRNTISSTTATSTRAYSIQSISAIPTQSNDIDSFIQSLDDALQTPVSTSSRTRQPHVPLVVVNTKSTESKCISPGILSNADLWCSHLICSQCDMHVVRIANYRWKSSVDYMFLRLNCPNVNALKSQLEHVQGCIAYCCQCKAVDCDQRQLKASQMQCKWICDLV